MADMKITFEKAQEQLNSGRVSSAPTPNGGSPRETLKVKQINKLTSIQIFNLYGWLKVAASCWSYGVTCESLGAEATTALGFYVNKDNVFNALGQLEIKLPTAPKTDVQKIAIMARAIAHLYQVLGSPLPDDWKDLVL